MTNLSDAQRALGQHIMFHCREAPSDSIHSHVPDDVELESTDWTIEEVDECQDGAIEVHATQDGYESIQVASAGRWNDADYEHYDGTAIAVARVNWSDDPEAGDCFLEIDWEGGAPTPPDPEPYEDRL